jgi:hypothetical protein
MLGIVWLHDQKGYEGLKCLSKHINVGLVIQWKNDIARYKNARLST